MKVFAVIPAYNEGLRIADTIVGLSRYVEKVIVVDDGSNDQTAERARQSGATVLQHSVNRGQGAALKTGTIAALDAGAEAILHIDADGQHDPESLPDLFMPIETGEADVVFGSRFLGKESAGMPTTRRWLLEAAKVFNRYVLGVPREMTDPQSGLRVFSSAAADDINFMQDGFAHCSEILRLVTRSPWRWQEVPTRIRYTPDTLSKGLRPDAMRIVWQLFIGAFHK